MENPQVAIGEKYIDPEATPLKFHKFNWYIIMPLSVLNCLLNLFFLLNSEYLQFALTDILYTVARLVLVMMCIIGFRKWKKYSWYSVIAVISLTLIYNIFGILLNIIALNRFFVSPISAERIGSLIGSFVGSLIYAIPMFIYYNKRKALFFKENIN